MPDIQGGAAQPVQTSNQAPSGGPAIPVAVVSDGRAVMAGPYQPIVEVADNRARQGGAAMPVVVGIGSGVAISGDPLPVYVVSGSLSPVAPVLPDVASATLLLNLQADTGVTTSTESFAGSGTITQLLTAITGIGTAFRSEVVVGDRITSSDSTINGIVQTITDNTHLTLSTSATVEGGLSYNIIPQSDTARVTTWIDQSSGAHNFTQSGTARPSKQTIGGYPAIIFDGVNDWMLGSDFADNLASFTIFAVYETITSKIVIGKALNDDSAAGWSLRSTRAVLYLQTDGGSAFIDTALDSSTLLLGDPHLVVVQWDAPGPPTIRVDGTVPAQTPDSFGTVDDFSNAENVILGSFVDTGYNGVWEGHLYAAMIYTPAPNASDRAAIEAWLATRYGITL